MKTFFEEIAFYRDYNGANNPFQVHFFGIETLSLPAFYDQSGGYVLTNFKVCKRAALSVL